MLLLFSSLPSCHSHQAVQSLLSFWQGYNDVWGMNGTILQCVEAPAVDRRTLTAVAAVSAVAGLALLAALLLLGQLYLRTRPKWLRERVMQARRAQVCIGCHASWLHGMGLPVANLWWMALRGLDEDINHRMLSGCATQRHCVHYTHLRCNQLAQCMVWNLT